MSSVDERLWREFVANVDRVYGPLSDGPEEAEVVVLSPKEWEDNTLQPAADNAWGDNYKSLQDVLARAHDQAAAGKGAERHANNLPFEQQPILAETRAVGIGFVAGQARKKILEATRCWQDHPERAVADLLGAINYIAAEIIYIEEQQGKKIAVDPAAPGKDETIWHQCSMGSEAKAEHVELTLPQHGGTIELLWVGHLEDNHIYGVKRADVILIEGDHARVMVDREVAKVRGWL